MPMPMKPTRHRRCLTTDDITIKILEFRAYDLGYIRAGKGDVGQLMDALASILSSDTPTKKILEGVLDTLRKTV